MTGIPFPVDTLAFLKNTSLGAIQLTRLGRLKTQLSWMRGLPLFRTLAEQIFHQARKLSQSHPPTARWDLTVAEKREVIELYRESNTVFKRLLGSQARRTDWKRWFSEIE